MAATLPLSSPHPVQVRFASEPQTQMDQEAADKLNSQIDDELKVRFVYSIFFFLNTFFILRVNAEHARENSYDRKQHGSWRLKVRLDIYGP